MAHPAARPKDRRNAVALVVGWTLALAVSGAFAHPDRDEQLAQLTFALEKSPADATLWLRRSEVRRQYRQFELALTDVATAARLKPGWSTLFLAGARILFDAQRTPEALSAIEEFLQRQPGHADGLLLRARCWLRLGDINHALAGYTAALERFAEPTPDLFLERARLQAALGRWPEAMAGLNGGIKRLGPVPALELTAIEYERQRGDFDAALTRAEAWLARTAAKEPALALRAELLEQSGRWREARDVNQELLRRIGMYSANRHAREATKQLEQKARDSLARLEAKLSRSTDQARVHGPQQQTGANP
jgi:tetratricopeptide (TPR) repeat protein